MSLPDLETELPPEALRVLARSTRLTTPCGDGNIVWHAWGSGVPLLLLHGGSGSWTHWVRNVEALAAAGRRVLVPDLPGCGDSARPPGGQDADAIVPPLAAGLRELLGGVAVDVVGFSFGGLVTVLLTAAHPELVRRIVLMGAPGMGLRSTRLPVANWRHAASEAEREAAHRTNLATWMVARPESIDAFSVALQGANVKRDRMLKRRLAMTDIVAQTLPQIACRVDAIYGELDSLYREGYPRLRPQLERAPRFGELVLLPRAGHWLQFEEPAALDRELLRLLAIA
jgi:pimeloyl-ACP methyl ester carboxylesterase